MSRDSFVFYRSWYLALKKLPNELRLMAYDATMEYALDNHITEVTPLIEFALDFIKPRIDSDRIKYEKICERNKENSTNAGRKPKTKIKRKRIQKNPVDLLGKGLDDNDIMNNDIMNNLQVNYIPNGYESFDFCFVDKEFSEVFFSWLDYKRERKEKYKTQRSIEQAYKRLYKLSEGSATTAKEIIEQSLANNWAGLFELKEHHKYGNNGNSNEQSTRSVGEKVLGEIFAEIEQRQRTERTDG